MRNNCKTAKKKLSNSIYIPSSMRQKLEELALETGFQRKRQISKSAFVQYLIEQFGDQAKDKIISDSIKK